MGWLLQMQSVFMPFPPVTCCGRCQGGPNGPVSVRSNAAGPHEASPRKPHLLSSAHLTSGQPASTAHRKWSLSSRGCKSDPGLNGGAHGF